MNMVRVDNGKLTTTSKIIADYFGKPHRDVTKAIDALTCSNDFSARNFSQSEYTTERGKTYKCHDITEKGFYFLAMGFTGEKASKWKEAFLNEFERLRSGTINADTRINEISLELSDIKEAGKIWSKAGSEIKRRKRIAIIESNKLIEDVQLKLEY